MATRGPDRHPYGSPANYRRPGTGRRAKYPWHMWLGTPGLWQFTGDEIGTDVGRFPKMVGVRVAKVNQMLRDAGNPGWVAHKAQKTGPNTLDLIFWWIPAEGAVPEDIVPAHIRNLFVTPINMCAEDVEWQRSTLAVKAYPAHQQDNAMAVICPATWDFPRAEDGHYRGAWAARGCATCATDFAEGRAYTPKGAPTA